MEDFHGASRERCLDVQGLISIQRYVVATLLVGRGHRVLAVDLDMASPNLGPALGITPPQEALLTYLFQRFFVVNGAGTWWRTLAEQLASEVPLPNTLGKLFVVPAGDQTLRYLTEIDCITPVRGNDQRSQAVWEMFYTEMVAHLQPDMILVDTQVGFDRWSAFALLHAADQALLFLQPAE